MSNKEHKEFMEKLEELHKKTKVIIEEALKALKNNFDLDEDTLLQALETTAGELKYQFKKIDSMSEDKKDLLKKHADLTYYSSLIQQEIFVIMDKAEAITIDELIKSKILGTVTWEIDNVYSNEWNLYIKANLRDNKEIYNVIKNPFISDYHWDYCIYKFPNNKSIRLNCDDGELSIGIREIDDISVDEYKHAFDMLGIKINFLVIDHRINQKQKELDKLKEFVEKFR